MSVLTEVVEQGIVEASQWHIKVMFSDVLLVLSPVESSKDGDIVELLCGNIG